MRTCTTGLKECVKGKNREKVIIDKKIAEIFLVRQKN